MRGQGKSQGRYDVSVDLNPLQLLRYRDESAREQWELKQEVRVPEYSGHLKIYSTSDSPSVQTLTTIFFAEQIAKLKEDFAAIQRQNSSLQYKLRGHAALHRGNEAEALEMPRKRQRSQSPDEDSHPRKQVSVPVGFSREQIKSILGGPDRGWGLMLYVFVSPSPPPTSFVENPTKGAVPGLDTRTMSCSM